MAEVVAVGTRFWGNQVEDLDRLDTFIDAACGVSDRVLVAINEAADTVGSAAHVRSRTGVEVLALRDWGFAPALNALIEEGASSHEHMLLASVEYPPTTAAVRSLAALATEKVVYAGAVLEDHEYHPGRHIRRAQAKHVPRNTFAVVNLPLLRRTMVPEIVDTPEQPDMAGMEEVVTLAVQEIIGNTSCLTSLPEVAARFNATGWSEERLQQHAAKIASKQRRSAYQLHRAGLTAPTVTHI